MTILNSETRKVWRTGVQQIHSIGINAGRVKYLHIDVSSQSNVFKQKTLSFVGEAIQSDLKQNAHIDHINSKFESGSFMLRDLKEKVDWIVDILPSVNYQFPNIGTLYCTILWSNSSSIHKHFVSPQKRLYCKDQIGVSQCLKNPL